ncbi:WXG100-like domain-containing protein [Kribbella swartbergensis]
MPVAPPPDDIWGFWPLVRSLVAEAVGNIFGWPDQDEDVLREVLAVAWDDLGNLGGDIATAAGDQVPTVASSWPDYAGGAFNYTLSKFAGSGPGGAGATEQAAHDLAQAVRDLAVKVKYTKEQIVWEVAVNLPFYAATFAAGPAALAAAAVARYLISRGTARLVSSALTKLASQAASSTFPRALGAPLTLREAPAHFVRSTAFEIGDELLATVPPLVNNDLLNTEFGRQQLQQAGLGGGLGEGISRVVGKPFRVAADYLGRGLDRVGASDLARRQVTTLVTSFGTNSISSPVSSQLASDILNGTWSGIQGYVKSIADNWLSSGVHGSLRANGVDFSRNTSQIASTNLANRFGFDPTTFTPPPPGGPPVVAGDPGPSPGPAGPAAAGKGASGVTVGATDGASHVSHAGSGTTANAGAGASGTAASGGEAEGHASSGLPTTDDGQATTEALGSRAVPQATGHHDSTTVRPGNADAGHHFTDSDDAGQVGTEAVETHPVTGGPGLPADSLEAPDQIDARGNQIADPATAQSSPTAETGPPTTASGEQPATAPVVQTSAAIGSAGAPSAAGHSAPLAQTSATVGSAAAPSASGHSAPPPHTSVLGAHQTNTGNAVHPAAPVEAKGRKIPVHSSTDEATDEGVADNRDAEAAPVDDQVAAEGNGPTGAEDAARAAQVARGVEFAKVRTTEFVPDADGFQGRDSVVPPELLSGGPFGETGPAVAALAPASPTGIPQVANSARRGPNRDASSSAGPVHTRSSRSGRPPRTEDDSARPAAQSGTKGPVDNDPPPPPKRGPADEADDRDDPQHNGPTGTESEQSDSAAAEQGDVRPERSDIASGERSDGQAKEQSDVQALGHVAPVGERVIGFGLDDGPTVGAAAFAAFVRALNERDANDELTQVAQELRREYYKRPDGERDGNPTGVVQRLPGRRTFLAAGPDGKVFRVPVPPLEYLVATGDFAPVRVPSGPGPGAPVRIERWEGPSGENAWFDPDLPVAPAERRAEPNPDWTQWHSYEGNKVRWLEESPGRGRAAEAVLREDFGEGERPRDDHKEREAAAARGIDKDDGGHVVGWRFFRQVLPANYFPQNLTFNRGAYKTFENEVADWVNAGYQVELIVFLSPNQDRPDQVTFVYTVVDPGTGRAVYSGGRTFDNEPRSGVKRLPGERIRSHQPPDQNENLFEPSSSPPTVKSGRGPTWGANEVVREPNGEKILRVREVHPQPADGDAGLTGRPVVDGRVPGWGFFLDAAEKSVFPPGAVVAWEAFARLEEAVAEVVRRGQEVDLAFVTNPDTMSLEAKAVVADPATGQLVTYPQAGIAALADQIRPAVAPDSDLSSIDPVDAPSNHSAGANPGRRSDIARALNPDRPADDGDGPTGRVGHAPRVEDTRFVEDGREEGAGALSRDAVLDAARQLRPSDFGDLLEAPITVTDDSVVVVTADGVVHTFKVEEPAPVRPGRLAATHVGTGNEHRVVVAPGVADDQLARLWVHEISHTLQDVKAAEATPVRRLWNKMTGGGPNPCVEAQFNEFRYLRRQWAAAVERGDDTEVRLLEEDIRGLAAAIGHHGRTPPALPWEGPPVAGPRAELRAEIEARRQALDDEIATLQGLIDTKTAVAGKAVDKADEESEKAKKAGRAKDEGRYGRVRAAEAEARKQKDLAEWHRQVAANYRREQAKAIAARDGYQQLLAGFDASTTEDLLAEATRLAAEVASYEQALDELSPRSVVAAMTPTDELPHLPALVKQVNAVLAARGIDERFTAAGLQSRLNAGFGALAGEDGVILRVGRKKTAELRIRLEVTRLREVPGPPKTAGEIMRGRFPQPARRVATTMISRFNQTYSRSANDVLEWLGGFTHVPWLSAAVLSLLAVKAEVSVGDSRAVTATGAEFAQDGAVEDIRGESVMFSGRASYEVDLRTDRKSGWSPAQTVVGTDELRAWIPHTYTVPPATDVTPRRDLRSGRLPAQLLSSISGLEQLTDDVIAANDKELRQLGAQRGHVEEQIHAALTTDLAGRLTESTRRPLLLPLMADGKPAGYIEVTTKIRYESVTLAGAQSVTHWQESVRVGQSVVSVQQTFGSNDSESVGLGHTSAETGDDGSGIGFAVGASAGRTASRSESLSGGSTAYQVGVHRFVGPTQGYRMVLDHDVTVVLNGKAPTTTPGSSNALMRIRVKDAYRSGFPVDSAALVRPDGRPGLQGEVQSGVEVPGRKLELPSWAAGNGKLRAAGPWNIQEVTGGEKAFRKTVEYLAERGFVPPLDADHNPDLRKLSTDPIERHAQILNLEELRTQLSTERLEAGYDIAARGGIVVTLNLPSSRQPTETISLRIGIDQHEVRTPVGVTTDEAVVFLNIGSDTAGRSGGRTRAFTAQGRGGPERSVDGAEVKSGLAYGRQFLGRVLSWLSGGTINQVTLVESNSPVAVFEVPHTLTVTEVGTGTVIHQGTGESARLLIDSDFLPYADSASGDPSPWESEQRDPGPVPVAVLDRAILLAVGETKLVDQLPEAITSDPAALQQLSAFLNERNLLAHPEWARTGLPTTIVVAGPNGTPRRVRVTLTGRIRDPKAVGQTEGTAGDINFALGSHGVSSARPTGHSGDVGTSEAEESTGGGLKVTAGRSGARSRTDQHIWGVERLTIETGRHTVFDAIVDFELTIGDAAPVHLESGVVFQLAERDALRFYGEGKLTLSLRQAADAVERYLQDDLTLDRRTIGGLLRRYHAELTQARDAGTTVPELSAAHTTKALADKFWRPSPNPSAPNAPQPAADDHEGRLRQALLRAEDLPRVDLPAHYREHLGSSLVESAELDDGTDDVQLLDEVRAMLKEILPVELDHDPALAQSLFADLAGKRWWGRLEDMLGPRGLVRRYPVGRPGDLTAEQVEIRITARFAGEVVNLGSTKDVVSIVQRYLYDDRSRTRTTGRAAGIGADGLLGDLPSGSAATDRADGSSTTTAEQLTRLERIATFGELTRVGRDFELVVEVTRDAVDPTRGDIARILGADEKVIARAKRSLRGNLVQLVPTAMLRGQPSQATAPQAGDQTAVPVAGTAVRMPPTYFVEGVGPGRFDRPDLFEAAVGEFADLLGPDGIRVYRAQLENQLAASAAHGEFSRMATEEGFRLQPMTKPGSAGETVDVTVHARISSPELVSGPLANGELGDINRFQRTVSTSTTAGRSLPLTGAGTGTSPESGVSVRVSAGEQVTDTTTDAWGTRDEISRMERSDLVTIRVRVDYDLTIVHRAIGPDGTELNLASRYRPGLTTGEAYLTLHEHDYRKLTRKKVVRSPEVEDTLYVADGRRASDGVLKPADAVLAALGTRSADFGGLITADPAVVGDRTVVVRQGDSSQYFSVQVGDVDSGMAFTELHEGSEGDPHVVTFAPGVVVDQLARVWVHEISHTLQELAASGEGPLQRITGALTTDGENACVDAQYNEFRFLVRQWSEAFAKDDQNSVEEVRRDAEGLARAIEARGFRPPAIPWLTQEELIEAAEIRHQELIPEQPTLLHRFSRRPRVVLLDGAQGADLRAMQERILAGFDDPDSVVRYDPEDDYHAHPRYEAIMREWGAAGSELIGLAVLGLRFLSLEAFVKGPEQYDVVIIVPAAHTLQTKSYIADFDVNYYRVSVVYVAMHETTRLLGRIEGYQSGRDIPDSRGRPWAPLDWHDVAEAELPDMVHLMETGDWATDVYVVTPEGDVLHENHQDGDGNCEGEPAARETYVAERDRPPTPLERACFEAVAAWLLYGRAGLPPLEDEVQQAVLTAISRELTRPEPWPDDRQFGDDDKIEHRLRRYDDPIDRNFEEEKRWQAWKEARWEEDGPFP